MQMMMMMMIGRPACAGIKDDEVMLVGMLTDAGGGGMLGVGRIPERSRFLEESDNARGSPSIR